MMILVAPDLRRRGYGHLIIESLVEVMRGRGCVSLQAIVDEKHLASVMTFSKAGFARVGETSKDGFIAFVRSLGGC